MSSHVYRPLTSPITPTRAPVLAPTAPFVLELSATPGIGANSGHATITARVLNPSYNPLKDMTVAFTAAAGTLSADQATTNQDGIATTVI